MKTLMLLCASVAFAQIPPPGSVAHMTAGALSCGVVMRAVDTIQVYCYQLSSGPLRLVSNGIYVLGDDKNLILDFNSKPDIITWQFWVLPEEPTFLRFNYVSNGAPMVTGKLTLP